MYEYMILAILILFYENQKFCYLSIIINNFSGDWWTGPSIFAAKHLQPVGA